MVTKGDAGVNGGVKPKQESMLIQDKVELLIKLNHGISIHTFRQAVFISVP